MLDFVIAIDGMAASGKGTLSRSLAHHFGFDYLDTGLIYRKAAYFILKNNIDIKDTEQVARCINDNDIMTDIHQSLHTEEMSFIASSIATHQKIRDILAKAQRDFPKNKRGAVVDGRDIGTVIFPDAQLKLFITADLEVRAERRYLQLQAEEKRVSFEQVFENLRARDERDSKRSISPTVPAHDAIVIDSSSLNPQEVLQLVILLCSKVALAFKQAS